MIHYRFYASRRRYAAARAWVLALCTFALACGHKAASAPPAGGSGEDTDIKNMCASSTTVEVEQEEQPEVECGTGERILLCYGDWAAHCDDKGKLVSLENCREDKLVCATHKCKSAKDCTGCRKCVPGDVQCGAHGELRICDADGSGYSLKDTCDEAAGKYCSLTSGQCEDLCATAEKEHSYIGCEYWAVATSNSELLFESQDSEGICHPFSFAAVVANPQGVEAEVSVHSPGFGDRTVKVAPSETKTIELPCSPELKGESPHAILTDAGLGQGDETRYSVQTASAAHHITSNVPITVYQFNPLEFQAEDAAGDKVYSYTADSSLLLPTSSMTGNYVVIAQPTLLHKITPTDTSQKPVTHSGPGFVAIIGVESDPVDVEVTSSAYTQPSADDAIPALAPGDKHTFTLAQGETLQLLSAVPDRCDGKPEDGLRGASYTYCKVPRTFDLTGTRIRATGRVAVISGHDCVFLPHNRWACDHIEESMFPIEAWGKESYISVSESVACQPTVPNMVRVYSDSDGNRITFTPPVHDPITLDKGKFVEFEVKKDFHVFGSEAILVAQFLLGQDYKGRGSAGTYGKGDPSLSLGEPVEQWRKRYAFLTPETYTDNYVNIIARSKQLVLLDGRAVSGFDPIEGTKMSTARMPVMGGEHRVESAQTIGIVVYGYAPYTSYMMPGGLDLQPINGPD